MEWGHLCMPPSAWESTSGASGGTDSTRQVGIPPVSSHAEPSRAARPTAASSRYGDIPELGLVREERALSSLYTMSCSCQAHARTVSLCSKWQLNTGYYREASSGDHWQHGESSALQELPVITSHSG